MNTFFGIPAHPLLVHIPAVLLPLAALGVVVMVLRPQWHLRYRWAVLGVSLVGTLGAILAADAGESFAERIEAKQGFAAAARWDDHIEAGDTAQVFAIIFLVAVAIYVLVPFFVERRAAAGRTAPAEDAGKPATRFVPRWASLVMAVLVVGASIGTVTTVIIAGHSGAKSVWCETSSPPDC
ncbi:hypothetical protein BH10ACT2_BH10ACT2_17760 [soil metagenome]